MSVLWSAKDKETCSNSGVTVVFIHMKQVNNDGRDFKIYTE